MSEVLGSVRPPARAINGARLLLLRPAFTCLTPGGWEGLPRRGELSLLTDREPVRR